MPNKYIRREDGLPGIPPQDVVITVGGAATAIAANPVDGIVFIADRNYEIVKISECHSTVSGAVTVDFRKCTGTQAPAAGTTVLASTFATDSTVNIQISKIPGFSQTGYANPAAGNGLVTTRATRRMAPGDRLAMDVSASLASYVGLFQIHLRPLEAANDEVGF